MHGGLIGVSSEGEGCGSTFFQEVPCASCVAMAVAGEHQISPPKGPAAETSDPLLDLPAWSPVGIATSEDQVDQIHREMLGRLLSPVASGANSRLTSPPAVETRQAAHGAEIPLDQPVPPHESRVYTFPEAAEPKRLRVLIADDSALGRKMLRRALGDMAEICHEAEDGEKALTVVASNISFYDLVMSDLHMPKVPIPWLWLCFYCGCGS